MQDNQFNFTQEFWLVVKDGLKIKKYTIFIRFFDLVFKKQIEIDKKMYNITPNVYSQLRQYFEFKTHIRHSLLDDDSVDMDEALEILDNMTQSINLIITKEILKK